MSKKNTKKTPTSADLYAANPYGSEYGNIWADVKAAKGIVTKSALIAEMAKRTGKSEGACAASVGVILSPRETSKGDCRGNASAKGHLYYFAKLKRKPDANGKKEEQRYRFFWRKEALAIKLRPDQERKLRQEADKAQADGATATATTPATADATA